MQCCCTINGRKCDVILQILSALSYYIDLNTRVAIMKRIEDQHHKLNQFSRKSQCFSKNTWRHRLACNRRDTCITSIRINMLNFLWFLNIFGYYIISYGRYIESTLYDIKLQLIQCYLSLCKIQHLQSDNTLSRFTFA